MANCVWRQTDNMISNGIPGFLLLKESLGKSLHDCGCQEVYLRDEVRLVVRQAPSNFDE